jgi:DNA-binding GntR family transcriptional regulator
VIYGSTELTPQRHIGTSPLLANRQRREDEVSRPRPTEWGAYAQIASILRGRINSGELPPGPFPSEATLCAEFRVTRNTLRRALSQLQDERLIEALPGRGRVVLGEDARGITQSKPKPPRYKQIATELRSAIADGKLPSGTALPTESEITEQYGVSRGTVRQALADLSGSGHVEPVQGKGWFVR